MNADPFDPSETHRLPDADELTPDQLRRELGEVRRQVKAGFNAALRSQDTPAVGVEKVLQALGVGAVCGTLHVYEKNGCEGRLAAWGTAARFAEALALVEYAGGLLEHNRARSAARAFDAARARLSAAQAARDALAAAGRKGAAASAQKKRGRAQAMQEAVDACQREHPAWSARAVRDEVAKGLGVTRRTVETYTTWK